MVSSRLARSAPFLILVAALGFLALLGQAIWRMREAAWVQAQETVQNNAQSLQRGIGQTIATLDLSIIGAQENLLVEGFAGLTPDQQRRVLFDRAATLEYLRAILVLDADGRVQFDSSGRVPLFLDFGDTDYFIAHRDDPGRGLFISLPFRNRVDGEWFIALSRRRIDGDGRFAGVVAGALSLEALRRRFDSVQLSGSGTLGLFDRRGQVVLRMPGEPMFGQPADAVVLADTPAGPEVSTHTMDGAERLRFVLPIEATPLLVHAGVATADIRARWLGPARFSLAAAAGLMAVLALALLLQRIEWRRRQHAEHDLAQSEARFRTLAENAGDLVTLVDLDGTRLYASPAAERILGVPPQALVGHHILQDIPEPERQRLGTLLWQLQTGAISECLLQVTVPHAASGRPVPLEVATRAVVDPDTGRPTGFVATVRDVSERMAQEAVRRRLDHELQQIGRRITVSALSSGLAHEIQQPLTAIANYARAAVRLLRADVEAKRPVRLQPVLQAMEGAAVQALRAGDIVRSIRDLVGQHAPDYRPEAVEPQIRQAVSFALAGRKDAVAPDLQLAHDLGTLRMDRVQIQQVLVNLIVNALEAMQEVPRPRLLVHAERLAGGIAIAVQDNGPGLTEEQQARIFQPFSSTKQGGLGIGLTICRSIIEAHGGSIGWAAAPGGGSVFRIVLPDAEAPAATGFAPAA